ncbi:MAG: integrase core domain-containing protein, partial [Thaumarchaeota archaeon]|nr:integrase core domain-containing protein [Nitrososphaerota archaeon]
RLGRKPETFTSDGLISYRKGLPKPGIRHISGRRFSASWNNNRLERFNKSVRRRVRVSEKFTDEESARLLMDGGYRSFYNLIRPHMALGGKTPAEKAGFRFRSQNHLLELVKKSRRRG